MFLKKSLGQHLLVAEPTLEKISRTLAPTKDDTVLEIGPGTGKLTRHLAKYAGRVIAVEKDREMAEALKVQCLPRAWSRGSMFQNVEIVHADFLKLDLTQTLKHLNTQTLFCGNIPYNISTPILFKLREHRHLFDRGVVTVQREVAQRLVAKPGGKDYGILSIMMQLVAVIEKCFNISAKSFIPPPKVVSSLVKITFPKKPPYHIEDETLFSKIVKSAFHMRRKMIRNSIPKEYLWALKEAGIDNTRRPETLSIPEFAKLCNVISAPIPSFNHFSIMS